MRRSRPAAIDRFIGDHNGEHRIDRATGPLGLTAPAVLFLQASRPYRPLGSSAMVFFDPTLRRVFGGELPVATEILADDLGIEQLIERLQDPDEEISWDA